MTIYTNSFIVTGAAYNSPIYTNTLGMNGYSNMSITSDLFVEGDVYSSGRLDVGTTVHATFRLASNTEFGGSNEFSGSGAGAGESAFALDFASSQLTDMISMPLAVASSNIYNEDTGVITIPIDGLYSVDMQGSFSNIDMGNAASVENGVYYKLLDRVYPDCRIAGNIVRGNLVSTRHMAFMEGGERLLPVFYSSDSNAVLLAEGHETYVSFTLAATYTPKG